MKDFLHFEHELEGEQSSSLELLILESLLFSFIVAEGVAAAVRLLFGLKTAGDCVSEMLLLLYCFVSRSAVASLNFMDMNLCPFFEFFVIWSIR